MDSTGTPAFICLVLAASMVIGCGGGQRPSSDGRISLRLRTHTGARYQTTLTYSRHCPAGVFTRVESSDLVVRWVGEGRIELSAHRTSHEESTDPSAPAGPDATADSDYTLNESGRSIDASDASGMVQTGGVLPETDVQVGDSWSSRSESGARDVAGIAMPAWRSDVQYTFVAVEHGPQGDVAVIDSHGLGGPDRESSESFGDVRVNVSDAMVRTERSRRELSNGCTSTMESETVAQ